MFVVDRYWITWLLFCFDCGYSLAWLFGRLAASVGRLLRLITRLPVLPVVRY
jgi:hypothetical protein